MSPHELILLPGMGTDERLLGPQREAFPELVVPRWLPPEPRESLAGYAARMAQVVGSVRRPLVLGGVSLGGMIAWEMARHLRPEALVLIGSASQRRGFWPAYRVFTPVAHRIPMAFFAAVRRPGRWVVGLTSGCDRAERQLLQTMIRDMDPAFTRWACAAVLRWRPEPLPETRVWRIHGRWDIVLPAHRTAADEWIPRGGHVINVTHAAQVNEFLRRVIDQTVGGARP